METPLAYFNGALVPASSACLALTDTGFIQGTAVTEQLRTFGGRIFHLDEHLARLERSLRIVDVDPGISRRRFAEIAEELVDHNHRLIEPGDDLGVSIFVTPGLYPGYSPPGPCRPTVCLHTYPLQFRLWADKYRKGQALVVTRVRQVPAECWPPELKCRSRMHYYLADRQAATIEPGARALLLDMQGFVTEASTANLVIYRAEEGLVSPPKSKSLPGISMAQVFELAGRLQIDTSQRDLRPEDVAAADEAMLTSTPLCLLPVTRLNGQPIGDGAPGPVFHRLLSAWSDYVGVDIVAQAERFAGRDRDSVVGN